MIPLIFVRHYGHLFLEKEALTHTTKNYSVQHLVQLEKY